MFNANDVQAVLLGAGGFLGTTMAGIGFMRLCNSTAKRIGQIPIALTNGAEELGRMRMELSSLRAAVESDQTEVLLIRQMSGTLKSIQEDITLMKEEREQFGREFRLIARKIEGLRYEPCSDEK